MRADRVRPGSSLLTSLLMTICPLPGLARFFPTRPSGVPRSCISLVLTAWVRRRQACELWSFHLPVQLLTFG